jgi:peptide/nickel transport system permease protein
MALLGRTRTTLFSSRAARKFRRNRMAVASLAVILLYALLGGWLLIADAYATLTDRRGFDRAESVIGSLFTALTLDKVDARVGPLRVRGWLETPLAEDRARFVEYYLGKFERALRLKDSQDRAAAVRDLRFAERRVDMTPEELLPRVRAIRDQYESLNAVDDLDAPDARGARERLAGIESDIDSLFAPLSGVEKGLYDLRMSLGTDRQGRSIAARAIYSIKVALQVGFVVGFVSVLIGALLGAASGYFGGFLDQFIQWLFSTLSSVPDLVLLAVLAYAFTGSIFDDPSRPALSLVPVYIAMCMTFWIGPCRVIRGETLKLKELEYVQAAKAIGFSRFTILLRHVLPNTLHLMFINFSLLFIAAIKFEVVLSFLGLGVKAGPSWGRMIGEATQEVINGNFWQIGAATLLMFVLVLAFNILSDALQDAFDPKHV